MKLVFRADVYKDDLEYRLKSIGGTFSFDEIRRIDWPALLANLEMMESSLANK